MQKTKGGCRWTIRLSNKDYAQKEVIRMFEYLLATSDYATESDIFREGIKSLYREKTEPDNVKDWDNRIQECARITADNVLERMQTMQQCVKVVLWLWQELLQMQMNRKKQMQIWHHRRQLKNCRKRWMIS